MTKEPWIVDRKKLKDLVTFARLEVDSGDLEPWAALIGDLSKRGVLDREQTLWLIKLYNAYDAIASAWNVFRLWQHPMDWVVSADSTKAADFPCTQERRNLRGGRVLKHLSDYAHHISGPQEPWLRQTLVYDDEEQDYRRLMARTRAIWGVGRQTAFEWAEFLGKAADFPVHAGDAELWESEGPRRSLQKLYGNPKPTAAWLDRAAIHAKNHLQKNGVDMPWEDFETVICDFNVMRDGRYYVGRHLAALREEIEEIDGDDYEVLMTSWRSIVPQGWQDIPPGINKEHMPIYKQTGQIRSYP